MTELARFGISIDPSLLESFDQLITSKGYVNRSEAIRDMIRSALVQDQVESADTTPTVGTVTLIYDHHTRDLSDKLTEGVKHGKLVLMTTGG
jgi:CopG family nickel-responsive transcriptional regulator